MRRLLGVFLLLTSIAFGGQLLDGNHYTGIEYTNSDLQNKYMESIDSYSLILAKGDYFFIDYPEGFEGVIKYDVRGEDHSVLDNISYRSIGGRFQYNALGSKGIVLGVKGSLDNDNFYEGYEDYFTRFLIEGDYPRKTGKTKSEDDFGAKFYGDFFKKIGDKVTIGFWNELVVGKDQITKPLPFVTPEGLVIIKPDELGTYTNEAVSLQITPKIIYQDQVLDNLKFVFEAFVENRKYFRGTFDVTDGTKDMYYKVVVNPQFILQGSGKKYDYYNYLAFENEKFQYIDYWQHIIKTSPRFTYKVDRFALTFMGGGYDFEDEIGIVFDNNELLAIKKSDTYTAWIASPRIILEYELFKNIYLGHETAYRYGEWTSNNEGQDLGEGSYIFYTKYEKKLNKTITFIGKLSYEIYEYRTNIPEEKELPEENIYRLSFGIKAKF